MMRLRYIFRNIFARDGLESSSSNLDPSVHRPKSSECECFCTHDTETQGGKEEVKSNNLSAAIAYQSNHTSCRRLKSENQSLEVGLEATLLMSSVHAAGAYTFGQMIRIREDDPNCKHSLEAFIALFAASFLCTFLGALTLLVIVLRREYHQYKKICLVVSNTASFVLMMIGYSLVVAFNGGYCLRIRQTSTKLV